MDTEHEELDTFLRRAARMAALGAAVGAVVGAARSARHASANGAAVEEDEAEREELEEEQPQAEAVQEPEAQDEADEADEPEQDEHEQDEPEPQAQDTDEPELESDDEADEAEPSEEPEPQSSNGGGRDELAKRVLQRLQELTGREPDAVLGLKRQDGGWLMSVEVVELRRVPSTTDVLATYEVAVDEDGEIQEYRRTGRYVRGRGETE